MNLPFSLYGICITLAILVCLYFSEKDVHREKLSISILWGAAFYSIIFGVIGARIYHVVSEWSYYQESLIRILHIWNGGLGIIGALSFGIITFSFYLYIHHEDILKWLDLIILYVPLGQAIGRIGNLINKEIGIAVNYEIILDLLLFTILVLIKKWMKPLKKGYLLLIYLLGYTLIRIALHPFRPDALF